MIKILQDDWLPCLSPVFFFIFFFELDHVLRGHEERVDVLEAVELRLVNLSDEGAEKKREIVNYLLLERSSFVRIQEAGSKQTQLE